MRNLQKGPSWAVDLSQCEDCNTERKPYTAIFILTIAKANWLFSSYQ